MPTKIYRLEMPWGENLYRHHGQFGGNGWPLRIEFFHKRSDIRKILGRWSACPNASVAARIKSISPPNSQPNEK